ncbi:CU044_2847 family protein [Streptomyces sp. CBMA152]|uniref:CU044_2847 family protein n=1 Tax=Streptomyces sp. CBMA152 TaxID=1896312 RepID=UPI001CB7493F|nr:CU044_2847 family protein [Streptomyces sp. CBMA152]
MGALMEFRTDDGAQVTVEVERHASGAKLVRRGDNSVAEATRTFDSALEGIRAAAESALHVFRDGRLRPDAVELEFGVKLTAEAGAVIAKTAVEGHLVVKLKWAPGAERQSPIDPVPAANPAALPAAEPGDVAPGSGSGATADPGATAAQ